MQVVLHQNWCQIVVTFKFLNFFSLVQLFGSPVQTWKRYVLPLVTKTCTCDLMSHCVPVGPSYLTVKKRRRKKNIFCLNIPTTITTVTIYFIHPSGKLKLWFDLIH